MSDVISSREGHAPDRDPALDWLTTLRAGLEVTKKGHLVPVDVSCDSAEAISMQDFPNPDPEGDPMTLGNAPARLLAVIADAAARIREWAQAVPERQSEPDLSASESSYYAGSEEVPYSNGSHAEEYLNAAPELAARLWLAGKTAVKAWLDHVRHVEPVAQDRSGVTTEPTPAKETALWQPHPIESAPVEYSGPADVPEAFVANGIHAEELFRSLTREDRARIVLDYASQAGWAAFRDAMHSKHSLVPSLTDPAETKILSDGKEAYERFQAKGGSEGFEEFMTGRIASAEFNRARDAVKAAYERGELTIELNADAVRELKDLNIAVLDSERYYEALLRQEDRNPDARAKRDAMRSRVAMVRNRIFARIVVG